jgi:DNA-directed RNA polymerase specialized sigma54-like protein
MQRKGMQQKKYCQSQINRIKELSKDFTARAYALKIIKHFISTHQKWYLNKTIFFCHE